MTETKDVRPGHSDVTTEGIRVRVGAKRIEEHNFPDPSKNIFVYNYDFFATIEWHNIIWT